MYFLTEVDVTDNDVTFLKEIKPNEALETDNHDISIQFK
jgi:hypothetical protein